MVIVIIIPMLWISCGDVTQEMWLKKDGSGQLHLGYDLTGILPILNAYLPHSDTAAIKQSTIDRFLNEFGLSGTNVDTIINAPKLILARFSPSQNIDLGVFPDYLKELGLHIKTDPNNETLFTSIIIPFQNFKQLDALIDTFDFRDNQMDIIPWKLPIFSEQSKFTRKNFEISDYQFLLNITDSIQMNLPNLSYNEVATPSNLIFIYHFPYEIKKTTARNAIVDHKIFTLSYPLTELTKEGRFPGFIIKFKRK